MTINNLPAAAQLIVQNGFLLRFFKAALIPQLIYRGLLKGFKTPMHLGQSFTETRKGLLPIVQNAMTPATDTDITSGLTPVSVAYEQYSYTMSQYGQPVPINLLSSAIAIADLVKSAAEDLGLNAGQSLDVQARRRLSQAYRGGRTYITTAAGPTTTVAVNDISGFTFVFVNGVQTAVSVTNPMAITITESGVATTRNVTGYAVGTLNTAQDNITGTLTLSANVTVIVGDSVVSTFAPFSIRPGGGTTSYNLTGSNIMTLQNLVDATAKLRSLAIPAHEDGFYHAVLDAGQVAELFADSAFQRVYDTHADSEEFKRGAIGIAGGVKIFESQQAPNGNNPASVYVRRGFVTGKEVGYEAQFEGIARWLEAAGMSATGSVVYDPDLACAVIVRNPLDVLQQVVFMSWSFIGDWAMGTDSLSTIGNSTAYYKRAVMIETA